MDCTAINTDTQGDSPKCANPLYRPRPIKRARRTKADLESLKDAIYNIVEEDAPMTVRQVFYRMVSNGLVDKTEASYKNIVVRLLGIMRRDGELPFRWIADNTRWMRKPRTFSSLDSALQHTARTYRRAIWDAQADYVEIWLEKDALSGVLYDVCAEWDVPLMVTRGYPSLSYIHVAAETLQATNRPCYIYYFGDHDPSGVDIPRNVERNLRELAPGADLHFERVAVNEDQIEEFGLPTRPTKKTDSRAKSFVGESVEVDAIMPSLLRTIARRCIEQHINFEALSGIRRIEAAERDTLKTILGSIKRGV